MIDRQNCENCIFRDGRCIRRDCKYISRKCAEILYDGSGLICNFTFNKDDLKEICDKAVERVRDEFVTTEDIKLMWDEIEGFLAEEGFGESYRNPILNIIEKYTK